MQNLAYARDDAGNLSSRQDLRQSLSESFYYDPLNRLDTVRLNGSVTLDLGYNAIGNLTSKTGVGSYGYGSRPQAVTSAGGKSYGYDDNGNMASRAGASIAWTSYNLPSQINGPNGSDSFSYGPNRARYRHSAVQAPGGLLPPPVGIPTDTIYIGSLYEKVTTAVLSEHRHHILVAGRMVAQVTRKATGDTVYYLHRDHQGSLDAISDSNGQVLARMSFDAFGQRRNPLTWSGAPTALELISIQAITSRGYTGHEMLDASGTIHMNGRVYDPALGRVLSGDPTVPDPFNGQAHNRYSYALNNPLTLVDPSGFDPTYESGNNCNARGACSQYSFTPISGAAGNPFLAGDAASVGNRGGLLGIARLVAQWVASRQNAQLREQHRFAELRASRDHYRVGAFTPAAVASIAIGIPAGTSLDLASIASGLRWIGSRLFGPLALGVPTEMGDSSLYDLHRAVDATELADINECQCFRPGPGTMETKLFTLTVNGAEVIAANLTRIDGQSYTIFGATVTAPTYESLWKGPLDGIPSAAVAPHQLPAFNADVKAHGGPWLYGGR